MLSPPPIGDPPKKPEDPYAPTRGEVRDWIKKKFGVAPAKLPISKRARIKKRVRNKLRRRKEKEAIPPGKDISFTQGDAPWQVIYGETVVSGVIVFAHTTNRKRTLHMIIALAGHEITEVSELYLDGNRIVFGGSPDPRWAVSGVNALDDSVVIPEYLDRVFMAVNNGAPGNPAIADAVATIGSHWTSTHTMSGIAHAYLILQYNGKAFPDGEPDVTFKIKGKPVYDPRTGLTTYSNNSALCAADYLMQPVWGKKQNLSRMDLTSLTAAANVCDENAPYIDGDGLTQYEPRYTTNGSFTLDSTPEDILSALEGAFAGYVTPTGGKWYFYPGKWRAPVLTLTEDDLRSAPVMETVISRQDRFNGVRGTYADKNALYEVTDFTNESVAAYVAQDGGEEIYEDITLTFTSSLHTARRIARIALERIRRETTLKARWSMKALPVVQGDNISLTLDRYGFSGHTFEVTDFDFLHNSDGELLIELVLRQIDESAFTFEASDDPQAVVIPPTTDLPSASDISPLASLTLESGTDHLYKKKDGTIISKLYVSWPEPEDSFVTDGGEIEVQYKKSSSGFWQFATKTTGESTFIYIFDVEDGVSYDVRARPKNTFGVFGDWIEQSHTVVGKTAPPENVTGFSATFTAEGVRFTWNAVTDIDLKEYEIRLGASWASGTVIAKVDGTSHLHKVLAAGSYTYRIRAKDTSGNYSASDSTTAVTISAPEPVENLSIQSIDEKILIDWTAPATQLPISHYKVYRGATFGTATLLGQATGTFLIYMETLGGQFTYWVTAVDTGGNESSEVGQAVIVYNPPDYILFYNQIADIAGTSLTRAVQHDIDPQAFLAPVITGETDADHFANNSWTNDDAAIAAGYPYYLQPTDAINSAIMEEEIDYGQVLPSCRITVSYNSSWLSGSGTVTCKIAYRETALDSWIEATASQVFAKNFQYVRVTLEVSADDDTSLIKISAVRTKLDVKKQTDSGQATANAADVGGTTVNFNLSFLDVESVVGNENGSNGYTIACTNFLGASPTTFKAYAFDKDGNRVTTDFSWTAEGIIEVIS